MFFRKRLKTLTPEQEKEKREELSREKVGWKDKFAMIVSAYVVLMLPAILIIVALCAIALGVLGLL